MTGIDINLRKSKRMIIDWDKIFWREQVFIYTVASIFGCDRGLSFFYQAVWYLTQLLLTQLFIINSINNYIRMNLFNLIIRWIFTQKTVSLWELSQLGLPNFINFMAARYWVRKVPVIGQAVEYSLTPLMYYISCLGVHNIIASSWQTF